MKLNPMSEAPRVIAVNIVTVDVQKTLSIPFEQGLAIFIDRSPRYVSDRMRRRDLRDPRPHCIALTFYTAAPDKISQLPSWRRVRNGRLCLPYYVGNLSPMREAMDRVVDNIVSDMRLLGPVSIVVDERYALGAPATGPRSTPG